MVKVNNSALVQKKVNNPGKSLGQKFFDSRYLLLMFLPVAVYYIIFSYTPMYGLLVAFQDFIPGPKAGFLHSRFVGFEHFINFFSEL